MCLLKGIAEIDLQTKFSDAPIDTGGCRVLRKGWVQKFPDIE